VYTRRGDKGETSLFGRRRVPKDSPRVEAYGDVDELNSCLGISISVNKASDLLDSLKKVQNLLFVAGADLATDLPSPGRKDLVQRIRKDDTRFLERSCDELIRKLPPLKNFILPGGSQAAANLQLARAVCRRAERRIIGLSKLEEVNPELLPFFNRLSTYLFNLARFSNLVEGMQEELWTRD